MSLRELQEVGDLSVVAVRRQLSVARVAGFVRMSGVAIADGEIELRYEPTPLGREIARRGAARAHTIVAA